MVLLSDILDFIQPIRFVGAEKQQIEKITTLEEVSNSSQLVWVNDNNLSKLPELASATIICSKMADKNLFNSHSNYIVVDNPRQAFQKILSAFFVEKNIPPTISEHAIIHPSVILGKNISIGHHTVIEQGCAIGDNVVIGHNNVLLAKTSIGNGVKIGNNNTIGGVGFGYEKDDEGDFILIDHIGSVQICDYVEIGNNTCIDRAVIGKTILEKNCKIDNLVHIAHGVTIGRNSLIIANAMIAGSTKIGENCWIAPSSSVNNKLNIADNTLVGTGAVVLKNTTKGQTVIGNPAKPLEKK
jgi:UDP-3-O-[3-hydroxymyristoyl] glucosamine N-acyltransferase